MWYAIFSDIHVLDNLCYQTHRSDIIDLSLSNIVGSLCVLKIKSSLIFIIATVWTTQLRVLSSHFRYKLFQHIYGHSLLFKGECDINIECLTSHQEWSPTIVRAVLLFLFLCHNMYILYFSSYFQTSYTCTIRQHMLFHTWVILNPMTVVCDCFIIHYSGLSVGAMNKHVNLLHCISLGDFC